MTAAAIFAIWVSWWIWVYDGAFVHAVSAIMFPIIFALAVLYLP